MKAKLKSSLRGIAIGIIVGTTIICSSNASAQSKVNDNQLIGMSNSVQGLPQLLSNYRQNGLNVNASVDVVGACFVDGLLKRVMFIAYPVYVGGPEFGHAPAMPIVIATVDFDCENKIIGSSLY